MTATIGAATDATDSAGRPRADAKAVGAEVKASTLSATALATPASSPASTTAVTVQVPSAFWTAVTVMSAASTPISAARAAA